MLRAHRGGRRRSSCAEFCAPAPRSAVRGCKTQEATKAYNSAKQRIPAVKYVGADSAAVRRYSDKSGNSDHYQREHAFTITPIVS